MIHMPLLDKVNCPDDVKRLNDRQISELSGEIREFLINNVMNTGGHLASNLGVVEITLALMKCFDFPEDKLVFDVGHQCYVYKMLTGRRDCFSALRHLGGISGFPRTGESEYDFFDVGHAGTSLSAAAGMARARDLNGEKSHVVVVVGDGALANGMCFEALNDVGVRKTPLIVILNDNEMSINRNIGGLSSHLTKLRFSSGYRNTKDSFHGVLGRLGKAGKMIEKGIHYIKSRLKYAAIASPLFEELGFSYMGIIDGNNYSEMCDALNRAKKMNTPVVIHTHTKKGLGYADAENNPSKFHGVNSETCRIKPSAITYDHAFSSVLAEVAASNPKVCAITAAMTSGCGLNEFSKTYPERFFDVGIAEEHAVTMAAGMAKGGCIPLVCMYSTFLQRTYDQIIHDVCLQRLHVVFCIGHAGLTGEDGETHQGLMDMAMLNSMPSMTLLVPSSFEELKAMILYAVNECQGPVAIRYPKAPVSFRGTDLLSPTGTETFDKDGDILILSCGRMTEIALGATKLLREQGINAQIMGIRSVNPLDVESICKNLNGKKALITLEDGIINGGMGQYVASKVNTCIPTLNIGFDTCFIPHGKQEELFEIYGLDEKGICNRIQSFYKGMNK